MSTLARLAPLLLTAAVAGAQPGVGTTALQRAVPNDNRTPGGHMERDTLVLRLTVTAAAWKIHGDAEPSVTVLAFAEEGQLPTIPGPLIRARLGTAVRVRLNNPLDDTLIVRGLSERGAQDSLVVLPLSAIEIGFAARSQGTFLYRAVSARIRRHTAASLPAQGLIRRGFDSQLAGAIVVDPPGRIPDDRIFVITQLPA